MDERIQKYLADILEAVNEIEEETTNRGRLFEVFCNDRVYRKFVERNIGIIGEAVNRILKEWPDAPITSARRIVNTRNLVIHSYDSIDKEIIWAIVIRHLPVLHTEVYNLLTTFNN